MGEMGGCEKVQYDINCSSKTTHDAVRGDLGWCTLQGRRSYRKLVYWFHIVTLDDNRILKQVYLMTKANGKSTSWAVGLKHC